MEKKILSMYDAQKALRNSGLKYAIAMANHKPQLVKINKTFLFYWEQGNYAYNPQTGLCGRSETGSQNNLFYKPAQINDTNDKFVVVEEKGEPALKYL